MHNGTRDEASTAQPSNGHSICACESCSTCQQLGPCSVPEYTTHAQPRSTEIAFGSRGASNHVGSSSLPPPCATLPGPAPPQLSGCLGELSSTGKDLDPRTMASWLQRSLLVQAQALSLPLLQHPAGTQPAAVPHPPRPAPSTPLAHQLPGQAYASPTNGACGLVVTSTKIVPTGMACSAGFNLEAFRCRTVTHLILEDCSVLAIQARGTVQYLEDIPSLPYLYTAADVVRHWHTIPWPKWAAPRASLRER